MKLSLATLLSIPALSADAIAQWLEARHAEIEPIGQPTLFLDAQTPESYMDACRSNGRACDAAKEAFRVCGLRVPAVWCEPVS